LPDSTNLPAGDIFNHSSSSEMYFFMGGFLTGCFFPLLPFYHTAQKKPNGAHSSPAIAGRFLFISG